MCLASPTMLAGIEKGEQPSILFVLFPSFETSMCSSQVILLKHMCLLFVELCSNDEVLRDDRVLVQDEQMTSISSGNVCYQQL